MKRRDFLAMTSAAGATLLWLPHACAVQPQPQVSGQLEDAPLPRSYGNLLILVELKGGNDGLNTVIPYADPTYYQLRKNIGIRREQVIQLDERSGLHPALQPLMPLWKSQQLAIVQGLGYAQPNLSHFRSIEIWDTASRPDQYLREGWLTRAFAQQKVPASFVADGVVIGSAEMGPLAHGARTIVLTHPAQFVNASRLAMPVSLREPYPGQAQIFDVEHNSVRLADRLRARAGHFPLKTVFPPGAFGMSIEAAMQVLAAVDAPQEVPSGRASQEVPLGGAAQGKPLNGRGVAVLRLTLNGFDTHQNQPGQQAALLKQLAEGLASMQAALVELGRWNTTMVMTYAEFGRRPRENQNNGTDHGTVAPHFVMGGRVRGGLYGAAPVLGQLEGSGNLPVGVDFRQLYATVLGPWWGLDATALLQQRFEPLPLLRA
jgi:uncharacterized protein (DUF1501 family)